MADATPAPKARTGSVQSIERAFSLLELMADAGGTLALSQPANKSGLPLPTIHRLLRTLVDLGYIRQESSRQYVLGPRLIRLGDARSGWDAGWSDGPALRVWCVYWPKISTCLRFSRCSNSRVQRTSTESPASQNPGGGGRGFPIRQVSRGTGL